PAASSPPDTPGAQTSEVDLPASSSDLVIPGPLRSFLRMAGISQKVSSEEVLPLLARNVFAQGYQGWQGSGGRTEFLVLLIRYVQQASELKALAGSEGIIHVSNCEEAEPLLRILGHRLRQDCGASGSFLVTADPERAFLTIDSGFPLPELEATLQGGKPFVYPFGASRVAALFNERDWTSASKQNSKDKDLVDALLRDPALARLYWAMARIDAETRVSLRQSPGLRKLLPFASVLDFYGSHICIRSGRVIVPGGTEVESAWKDLVGASPASPAEFVSKLLGEWGKRASHRANPEQLAQGMFAISRAETDEGPLQIYLTLTELDSRRSPEKRLSPQTVLLLADKFAQFSNQYLIFSEFPELSDASIAHFVKVAEAIDKIPNHILRGNAMEIFQAN